MSSACSAVASVAALHGVAAQRARQTGGLRLATNVVSLPGTVRRRRIAQQPKEQNMNSITRFRTAILAALVAVALVAAVIVMRPQHHTPTRAQQCNAGGGYIGTDGVCYGSAGLEVQVNGGLS